MLPGALTTMRSRRVSPTCANVRIMRCSRLWKGLHKRNLWRRHFWRMWGSGVGGFVLNRPSMRCALARAVVTLFRHRRAICPVIL